MISPTHRLGYNTSILDHILHPYENLVLLVPSGEMQFRAFGFKIVGTSVFDLDLSEELSGITVSAGDDTDWLRITRKTIGGESPDDYFYNMLKGDAYLIVHASIGVGPEDQPNTRVLLRLAGADYKVFFPSEGIDSWYKPDYIDPFLSPYSDPRTAAEFFLWKGISLFVKIKNDNTTDITPQLRILGAVYRVIPIKDKQVLAGMLQEKIRSRIEKFRGATYKIIPRTPDEWGEGIEIDQENINRYI